VYLILGSAQDACATRLRSRLTERGHSTRIVDGLLAEPHRFSWRFAGGGRGAGESRIGVAGEWEAGSAEIDGVLVRDTGWQAGSDWSEADGQYMSAEVQAALLGWLWSLPGKVVNRAPAWLFYRPRPPLVEWAQLLDRAGLRTADMVIGNQAGRLGEWRARHENGTVLAPLSSVSQFKLQTDAEWQGAMRLAQHTPVALREAHGETRLACVVGDAVLWDGPVAAEMKALEGALRRFTRLAELDFVQVAVAEMPGMDASCSAELAVVAVEQLVQWERFSMEAQEEIVEALAGLLTEERGTSLRGRISDASYEALSGGAA